VIFDEDHISSKTSLGTA